MMAPELGVSSGFAAAPMKRAKRPASSVHSALFRDSTAPPLRRSSLSSGGNNGADGEPACKRRLSFAETPRVIEIPRVAVTQADRVALRAAATAVAESSADGEAAHIAAWRELQQHITDRCLAVTFRTSPARRALIAVLIGQKPASAALLDITASTLALAAQTFGPIMDEGAAKGPAEGGYDAAGDEDERALCSAVMRSLSRGDAATEGVLESITSALVASAWVRLFPDVVLLHRDEVLRHAFGMLDSPGMDVFRWKSVMRLIALLACAAASPPNKTGQKKSSAAQHLDKLLGGREPTAQDGGRGEGVRPDRVRARAHREGVGGRSAGGGKKRAKELGIRDGDVSALLRSVERFGRDNTECTEDALRALTALCSRSAEVAAMVVAEDGAGVVRELASLPAYRAKCAMQIIVVDLLSTLATPSVLFWGRAEQL